MILKGAIGIIPVIENRRFIKWKKLERNIREHFRIKKEKHHNIDQTISWVLKIKESLLTKKFKSMLVQLIN